MRNYILQYKLLRFEQDILDENQNIIGYVNFYYKNIGQFLFKIIEPIINIKVENEKRELVLKLNIVSPIWALKKRWKGIIYGKPDISFSLTLLPKLKIGFFMELQINDQIIFIRDRTIGTEPYFLDSDNNIIAKCRDNLTGKVHMNIIDPELNVYLVAAITYFIRQY